MSPWDTAAETVEKAINTQQIGEPVAVRLVAHLTADHGKIDMMAARALAAVCRWLNGQPDRLETGGGVEQGQVSLLARLSNGRSALVSVGSSGMGPPLLSLLVFGNRGVLSWQDDGPQAALPEDQEDLSDAEQQLLRRIRKALRQQPSASRRAEQPPAPAAATPQGRKSRKPPHGLLLIAGDHTHQPNYAEALLADQRCQLIALADEEDVTARRKQLNKRLADRLGVPVLPLETALARDDVHIASICAEPIRRGRIVMLAAQAGKHLYLDKPLAGSLRDADAIIAATGTARTVDHMFSQVHTDLAERVRSLITSGKLGDLTAIHCDLCFAKGHPGTADLDQPRKETVEPQRYELPDSKRELTNVGVYPLVLLSTLVDRPVERVSAVTGNYFFAEHQENDMEDFGQMLLQLQGGVIATLTVGRNGWQSHPAGGLNRVTLVGTRQSALLDAHRPRIEVWADVAPWQPPPRNPEDPMGMWATLPDSPFEPEPRQRWITPPSQHQTDAQYFLDCIEQGRSSLVTAEVAAAATEVLLAGYQSAARGKPVALPLSR